MTKKQFLQTLFLFEIFFSSMAPTTGGTSIIKYKTKTRGVTVLNPLQLLSQLKQLTRLCFYLRRLKCVKIQFLAENGTIVRLLTGLYNAYPLALPYAMDILLHRRRDPRATGFLVQFGSQYFNRSVAIRRLFNQNIFFSQHFLLGIAVLKIDAYKTYLDYTDFKKVLFVGLLLGQCCEKKVV